MLDSDILRDMFQGLDPWGMYPVEMQVEGKLALFSRPDTGVCPRSYPVPTWSSCKGMFETVARLRHAIVIPIQSMLLGEGPRWVRMAYNYGGFYTKAGKDITQIRTQPLVNFKARIKGVAINTHRIPSGNPAHALQEITLRRLVNGQCYRPLALGQSNFFCDYFGPPRDADSDGNPIQRSLYSENLTMVFSPHNRVVNGDFDPVTMTAEIQEGIVDYCNPADIVAGA